MVLVPRTAPKVSFGAKTPNPREPPKNDTPGPGQYDSQHMPPALFTRSGAAVFGTCRRVSSLRESPGPGAYTLWERRRTNGLSWHRDVFTPQTSARKSQTCGEEFQEERIGPGPGAYDEPLSFNANGPSYSVAHYTATGKVDSLPGPGHYSQNGKPWKSRRGVSFGTSRRERDHIFKTPGPGQYKLSSTLGGPVASLTSRLPYREVDNGVPGPGAHDHHPDFVETAVW
jgi:hypothetical protein